MNIEEMMKFLEEEFPEKISDVNSSLELLYESLNDITEYAEEKVNDIMLKADYSQLHE